MSEDKNIKIARLIGLEKKAREARDKDELNFLVVNETREIINYTNSFLLLKSPTDKYHVNAVSDLATVDRTAPLITFVEDVMNDPSLKDLKEIELIDLEKLLNIDDNNLYNFYNNIKTEINIKDSKVAKLFKNFKF